MIKPVQDLKSGQEIAKGMTDRQADRRTDDKGHYIICRLRSIEIRKIK